MVWIAGVIQENRFLTNAMYAVAALHWLLQTSTLKYLELEPNTMHTAVYHLSANN